MVHQRKIYFRISNSVKYIDFHLCFCWFPKLFFDIFFLLSSESSWLSTYTDPELEIYYTNIKYTDPELEIYYTNIKYTDPELEIYYTNIKYTDSELEIY